MMLFKKKRCKYEWRDYKCSRPALPDDEHCIFHSKKIESKKKKFNDAFREEFERQKENDDKYDFTGFVFPGDISFEKKEFRKDAVFRDAQFSGKANFKDAQFSGRANFKGAQFSGKANFLGAQFLGEAEFGYAHFSGDLLLESPILKGG